MQYDKQGTGLSDRTLDFDAGFERHADEVIELLDHLRIEQAARIGRSQSGPVVLDAAARFPERVSRVVVIAGYAKGPGLFKPSATGAMVEVVKHHWGYGSKILTDMFRMTPTAEQSDAHSEWMRRGMGRRQRDIDHRPRRKLVELVLHLPCPVIGPPKRDVEEALWFFPFGKGRALNRARVKHGRTASVGQDLMAMNVAGHDRSERTRQCFAAKDFASGSKLEVVCSHPGTVD